MNPIVTVFPWHVSVMEMLVALCKSNKSVVDEGFKEEYQLLWLTRTIFRTGDKLLAL